MLGAHRVETGFEAFITGERCSHYNRQNNVIIVCILSMNLTSTHDLINKTLTSYFSSC